MTRGPWVADVVFWLGLLVFVSVQAVFVGVPLWSRSLPPEVDELNDIVVQPLFGKPLRLKVPTGKATLIEATHKTIGYTAATDYTKLAQNVETNETQWETYNSVKDWRQEKARQERMEWDERAAGLVQLLSDLIPAERLDLSAAIEGLEALLGPAAPKALPKVSKAPTV